MTDRPKVFVTQYSKRLNFAEAEHYGEPVFLTQEEFRPNPAPPGVNDDIVSEIERKMQDYVPGYDYIVLTGSSIPNLIVGNLIAGLEAPHKLLKWSNRLHGYELFIVRI
jgi:hypothetical protein